MTARAIMFQGTGSNVGKSLVVAGLARALAHRGIRVAPFKPQNMSNNAAVTADGGEIGRAQALQARAARLPLSVHMNPVLLKPQSETGAQVIVQGRIWGQAGARQFQSVKRELLGFVLDSFARLKAEADIVLVEGAGSASEINLRANDIANMGFARAANVPVVLVGDIDRGGVIASLVGTKAVLEADDAKMIDGFIVNKMRGDPSLFADGMREIASRTGWAPLGLVPFLPEAARLPAEDALDLAERLDARKPEAKVKIAVPLLPRIANFDDFDPLAAEGGVDLILVKPGEPLPGDAKLIVLPGSKATIADLHAFIANGWDIDLRAHLRRGGHVLGICGGFQMLGRRIADPYGIEGPACEVAGLGLLEVETVLTGDKTLREVQGVSVPDSVPFRGYEMHVGRTTGAEMTSPVLRLGDGRVDGARSGDGRVMGTYVHGLFGDDRQRAAFIRKLGGEASGVSHEQAVEDALDRLAAHLERHLDIDGILKRAR
ncbi:cobyric acid synthase [Rhodoligotrophos ferricapiens]|uniref:cobyric acid synthase n=1 Tax=Rhodoligotrophos ferricapiens TaxID=3069264 RepID=UPI00315DD764